MRKVNTLFPKLGVNGIKDDLFCTICPLAKQTRSEFSKSRIKSVKILLLLHVDI